MTTRQWSLGPHSSMPLLPARVNAVRDLFGREDEVELARGCRGALPRRVERRHVLAVRGQLLRPGIGLAPPFGRGRSDARETDCLHSVEGGRVASRPVLVPVLAVTTEQVEVPRDDDPVAPLAGDEDRDVGGQPCAEASEMIHGCTLSLMTVSQTEYAEMQVNVSSRSPRLRPSACPLG